MPLALALLLASCPFLGHDDSHPPKTLLVLDGDVVARFSGPGRLGCAETRVQLYVEEPPGLPPIPLRLYDEDTLLVLEVPEVFVPHSLGAEQRLARWRTWSTWMEKVRELLREAQATGRGKVVLLGEGEAKLNALERSIAANLEAAGKEMPAHKPSGPTPPLQVGAPRRVVAVPAGRPVYWSGEELCLELEHPKGAVRCHDPKTRRWSQRTRGSRPPAPEPRKFETSYSPRAERCELVAGSRRWPLADVGLDLKKLLAQLPSTFAETRCERRPAAGAQQVRRSLRCPSVMALSPDGSWLALTLDVLLVTTACATRGTRTDDSETEVLETLLLLAPVQAPVPLPGPR